MEAKINAFRDRKTGVAILHPIVTQLGKHDNGKGAAKIEKIQQSHTQSTVNVKIPYKHAIVILNSFPYFITDKLQ